MITIKELSKKLNICDATIRHYQQRGMPYHSLEGNAVIKGIRVRFHLYDLAAVKKWMELNRLTGAEGRPRKPQAEVVEKGVRKILAIVPTDLQEQVKSEVYRLVESMKGHCDIDKG